MATGFWTTLFDRVGGLVTSQVPLEMHGMDGGMWGGMGTMMWLLMMIFWILVLLALAGGVYWLYSQLFGTSSGSSTGGGTDGAHSGKDAVDILDERYARGDIDENEYLKRKRQITGESEE